MSTRIPGEPALGTAYSHGYSLSNLDSPLTVEDASNFTTAGFDAGVVVGYPDNYTVCDRSGFRVLPKEIKENWDGLFTRVVSFDIRHPLDFIRSRTGSSKKGSSNPEEQMSEATYLTTNEVGVGDL